MSKMEDVEAAEARMNEAKDAQVRPFCWHLHSAAAMAALSLAVVTGFVLTLRGELKSTTR